MARVFDDGTVVAGANSTANYGKYCEDAGLDVNGSSAGTAGDNICHASERSVDPFGFWTMGSGHPDYNDNASNPTNKVKAVASKVKGRYQLPKDTSSVYEYGSNTTFLKLVDSSVAGTLRDCAECHVGGGAMQYPIADRVNEYDQAVEGAGNYTAYSHFIDIYDEDGDDVKDEVLAANWDVTGVMEMDCLMCHMEGYSWSDRTAALRKGQLAASAAVGAGLATASGNSTSTAITMTYGGSDVELDTNVTLTAAGLAKIKGAPPSENCSSCHFDMHQVDWKKRGSAWSGDSTHEVHTSIGCMGCHERTANTDIMTALDDGTDLSAWNGSGSSALLGHDPTKGNVVFSSLWNTTDTKDAKTCAMCHTASPTVEAYGAADPATAHANAGLTNNIVSNGVDGVIDASHLDIMTCDACHSRKLGKGPTAAEGGDTHGSKYEWGTGAAFVDATGPDHDGRLTVHDTIKIERDVEGNMLRKWHGNKIVNASSLITMFWRDKDDTNVDINGDGQKGGMDAVLPTHVMGANEDANNLAELTNSGNMTDAKINAQRTGLITYLDNQGLNGTGATLRLSWMGVLFRSNHGVSPAANAWGASGCTDCHAADAGFYNDDIDLAPRDLTMNYTASTQRTPFTKVNGGSQKTDFHPMIHPKDHKGKRSIAVQVANGGTNAGFVKDRSVFLYEEDMSVLPRTSVNGGSAMTTRAAFVSYLNGLTDGDFQAEFHRNHEDSSLSCDSCHVGDSLTFAVDTLPNCTNSCHGSANAVTAATVINSAAQGLAWKVADANGTFPANRVMVDARYSDCYEVDADNVMTDLGCTVTVVSAAAGCDVLTTDVTGKAWIYQCDSSGAKAFKVKVDNTNAPADADDIVEVNSTFTVTAN